MVSIAQREGEQYHQSSAVCCPTPKGPVKSQLLEQSSCTNQDPEDEFLPINLFEEPENFRPPTPPPTITYFEREPGSSPNRVKITLVGKKHSLWGHRLWNAGLSMSKHLDAHPEWCAGKRVLELGAAGALPSIIASLNEAALIVATDYPDPSLLNNIQGNARDNVPSACDAGTFRTLGFQWGQDPSDLLKASPDGFDLILMADLIFNHTEQANMLKSCKQCLAAGGRVFTTFSHHVVKWSDRDLRFFDLAREMGFKVEELYSQRWWPMFPEDDGDINVRSTVRGFILTV